MQFITERRLTEENGLLTRQIITLRMEIDMLKAFGTDINKGIP